MNWLASAPSTLSSRSVCHLTEQQAEEFLRSARTIARIGIVAVIRSFEADEEERPVGRAER
jgi:hypothetical protein